MVIIFEGDIRLDHLPQPFDINIIWPIDHDLCNFIVIQKRLDGAKSTQLVQNFLNKLLPNILCQVQPGACVDLRQVLLGRQATLLGGQVL